MTATLLDAFADSLEALDVGLSRTRADEAAGVIADVVEPPAVGTPLPFDGADLPDAVETDPSPAAIEAAATGVTAAGFAVAEHGSVVVESSPAGEELVSLFPATHVAVVAASDVVGDLPAAVDRLAERAAGGGDSVVATGPSATADMGELVRGAHGPRAVHVVLLEDR